MLNLARLQVLCEVVRQGSFSAAADSLSYTQSAISQSVARLEAETGAPLVVRGRRGVTPTPAGTALVSHAERIFEQVREAEADVAAVMGVRVGRLRVGSFPSGGASLMPPAVARFRRSHPHVMLTLADGEPEQLIPRLHSGRARPRAALRIPRHAAAPPPAGRGAAVHAAARGPDAGRACARASAAADAAQLSLTDLRDEQWVQTSATSPYAQHVVATCLRAGFEPSVAFESDDFDTVQGLVAAGVGVALIPRLALNRVHPAVVVRELATADRSVR